jgi:thiol-disulfide isomerase/thioredoxin
MRSALLLVAGSMLLSAPARPAEENIRPLAIGSKAPDFNLPGVDGRNYSLRDFEKSPTLMVVFTCNHCPTAQAYEERLKAISNDYKDKGVAVVAISPNDPNSVRLDELGYTDLSDSFDEMKIRARDRHFNFPYLYEGDRTGIARAYGPSATPHAFIFDGERRLKYAGRIDDNEREPLVKVRDARIALNAIIAGKPVPVSSTRSFGCSIKWAGKSDSVKQFMQKLAAEPVTVEPVGAEMLKELRKNGGEKVRLVNFWATWCGPCITEFPDLVTINRMYRHRAFELVTVAANFPDEQKEVLAFLKKNEASNKNFLFGDTDKYKLMGAFDPEWNSALPYTMLIAPGGEVLYKVQGSMDPLEVKRTIVKVLKEDRFK